MPIRLQVISSALLRNKVYVTGIPEHEASKEDKSFQVQVYSLDEAKWSTLPRAPIFNAYAAVVNERITLIGGRDVETGDITDVQATWFEEMSQWRTTRMPARRSMIGVCQHDNLLLVAGGVIDSAEKGKTTVVNTVNVYNHSTKDWITPPKALELPENLRSHHLVVFEEYIYIIGGAFVHPSAPEDGDEQFNNQAWRARWSDVKEVVQQPSKHVENVWEAIKAPPVLRPTVVVYKGFLLSIGGVLRGKPQNEIHMFVDEKVSNRWIKLGEMKVGRYRHGVVPGPVQSCGITLFVVGGYVRSPPEGQEGNVRTSSTEIVSL